MRNCKNKNLIVWTDLLSQRKTGWLNSEQRFKFLEIREYFQGGGKYRLGEKYSKAEFQIEIHHHMRKQYFQSGVRLPSVPFLICSNRMVTSMMMMMSTFMVTSIMMMPTSIWVALTIASDASLEEEAPSEAVRHLWTDSLTPRSKM